MMTECERRRLEEERERLVTALRGLGNLMRGTMVDVAVRCGRPRCGCATGAKHPRRPPPGALEGRGPGAVLGPARGGGRGAGAGGGRGGGLLPCGVGVGGRPDTLTARAGLPLVVETLRALGLPE